MSDRLREELKQSRPFASLDEEVLLQILRTADALDARLGEVLKSFDFSPTQYNVLRILRGAGKAGLPCGEIAGRMITRDPDITRLLDRLEKRGLVTRGRESRDRRVVTAHITPAGLEAIKRIDPVIEQFHQRQFADWARKDLRSLADLLDRVRTGGK